MYAKMTIIGRCGIEPEYRHSQTGKQYTRLSIAVSVSKEETNWYSVFLWDPMAEIMKSKITKGSLLFIFGRPQMGSYLDTQGEKKQTFSVTAEKILILGGWKDRDQHAAESDREGYAAKMLDNPGDFPF